MGYLCPTLKIVPQDFIGFTKYENFEFIEKDKGRYLGGNLPGTAYSILKEMDNMDKVFHKMKTPYILFKVGWIRVLIVLHHYSCKKKLKQRIKQLFIIN